MNKLSFGSERCPLWPGVYGFLLAGLLTISGSAETLSKVVRADLDSDGRVETIKLNSERPMALQILRGEKLLWEGIPSHWKPWKMEIADADGDGKVDIIIGVFKSTKFFPEPHNCLFIYGWSGDQAFPKWLGSSLARTFTDFLFTDTGDLIALETTLKGRKSAGLYRWNGFGFTRGRQLGEWRVARFIVIKRGDLSMEADGKNISISLLRERR